MKTVLITGGNKGIGLALTKDFLALEYRVIVIARDFKDFATPDEVAKTMLWLATESPEYINGTTIDVNNGSYMR